MATLAKQTRKGFSVLCVCLSAYLTAVSVYLRVCRSIPASHTFVSHIFVFSLVLPPLSISPLRRACFSSVRNNQTNERGRILRGSHAAAQPGAGLVPGAARVSQRPGKTHPPTRPPNPTQHNPTQPGNPSTIRPS